jgi:S1-C subfamily serine protease
MKNLKLCLVLLITTQLYSQSETRVNFVSTNIPQGIVYSIYMNDVNVGAITKNENLQVKMLSEGRISIIAIVQNERVTGLIDVEQGKEEFYDIGWNDWSGIARIRPPKDSVKIRDDFRANERTMVYQEKLSNPIGIISDENISLRPKQGSGFLINNEGYILTNFHVIDGADKVQVTGIRGDFSVPFTAIVIAIDRLNDLALIQIKSKLISFETPPYSITKSKNVSKAETVFALGYPMENAMGSEVKVTNGIINSITGYKQSISEFQISAAVQGGNSGGPLFNSRGEIIGIVSAKISSEIADQVGYAIKSDYIDFFLVQSGVTKFSQPKNTLENKSLSDQVELISDFIYVVKTE